MRVGQEVVIKRKNYKGVDAGKEQYIGRTAEIIADVTGGIFKMYILDVDDGYYVWKRTQLKKLNRKYGKICTRQ